MHPQPFFCTRSVSMMFACVYLLTGVCMVHGVKETRRYWGMFKLRRNQTRHSAKCRRFKSHVERPVAWMKGCDASTLTMEVLGRQMHWQSALAEETILAANALADGGAPSRGGAWAHPHIGPKGLAEAASVRRIYANAGSAAEAREMVQQYVAGLGDQSYLRMHCIDLSFRCDSHEAQQAKMRKRTRTKRYHSGCEKRKRWSLVGDAFLKHKYGSDVKKNMTNSLATRTLIWS